MIVDVIKVGFASPFATGHHGLSALAPYGELRGVAGAKGFPSYSFAAVFEPPGERFDGLRCLTRACWEEAIAVLLPGQGNLQTARQAIACSSTVAVAYVSSLRV